MSQPRKCRKCDSPSYGELCYRCLLGRPKATLPFRPKHRRKCGAPSTAARPDACMPSER